MKKSKSKNPVRDFAVNIDDKIEQLRLQTKQAIHEDRQLLQANRRIMNSLYPKC